MKLNKIRDLEAHQRAALERLRKAVSDPSLSVGDLIFCGGAYATVQSITRYAPGTHDGSPIRNDWTGVEVVTDNGTRWTGAQPEEDTPDHPHADYPHEPGRLPGCHGCYMGPCVCAPETDPGCESGECVHLECPYCDGSCGC